MTAKNCEAKAWRSSMWTQKSPRLMTGPEMRRMYESGREMLAAVIRILTFL